MLENICVAVLVKTAGASLRNNFNICMSAKVCNRFGILGLSQHFFEKICEKPLQSEKMALNLPYKVRSKDLIVL